VPAEPVLSFAEEEAEQLMHALKLLVTSRTSGHHHLL
jgi:hypothetical protein